MKISYSLYSACACECIPAILDNYLSLHLVPFTFIIASNIHRCGDRSRCYVSNVPRTRRRGRLFPFRIRTTDPIHCFVGSLKPSTSLAKGMACFNVMGKPCQNTFQRVRFRYLFRGKIPQHPYHLFAPAPVTCDIIFYAFRPLPSVVDQLLWGGTI